MFLNGHSWFSLRYGVLSPKDLVETAAQKGIRTLALTDINNTSGCLDFWSNCQKAGIKPILGIEFRRDGRLLFVGIARNREGFFQLNRLLTEHSLSDKPLPDICPPLSDTFIIYPQLSKPLEMFGTNEFVGIRPCQVPGLFSSPLKKHVEKLVMFSPITAPDAEAFRLHKLLRAIDLNTLVTKLRPEDLARPDEVFLSEAEIENAFTEYPKILENTCFLTENCSISFETGLQINRQTFTGSKDGDFKLLAKLAESGCIRRYGTSHKKARERISKELKIIRELDFCAYFLITWDIVRYAQSAGYHHVGRGSGANSIVAFALHITAVDPLELDLYFERFINPHRLSPPDFDVDFSWDERDDVIDYVFKRYGREHTALLATYSTFQFHATVRELGKVFGLPKADIDAISDALPLLIEGSGDWQWSWRKDTEATAIPAFGFSKNGEKTLNIAKKHPKTVPQQIPDALSKLHPWARHILKYSIALKDFPNYLSIHAGGILISEEPLNYATALQMMPKGFPITHFDMYGAEDWGFHKFDVLSQRGLGHLKDAVDLVKKNRSQSIDLHDIEHLKIDEKTRTQLRSGHCIGCFYIESPAMRGLLSKLRCENYVHLVAASSIIRPGVAQSGMMREYIQRFHQPNGFKYLHPVFEEHLSETFGVMVYQEDVMKIVHHFAGLDLDESDILRRMMTGKKRSSGAFLKLKQKYFDNCAARNYLPELTNEVWRQIESFAGYSFCKAHSASFAVESFQSLYLKAHFPLEFMVAVINNFGGFYSTEFYFHELRMAGATVEPPSVNESGYNTTISGVVAHVGFVHLKGFGQEKALEILRQRKEFGLFRNLADFVRRVSMTAEQLTILIRIGAFRFTGQNKYRLMWEKNALLDTVSSGSRSGLLFEDETQNFCLPDLSEGEFDQPFDEIDLLGFPLCSPFDLLLPDVLEEKKQGFSPVFSKNLREMAGKRVEMLGYFVARKDVRTKNHRLMHFGTWLDSEGKFFDTTHFPDATGRADFRGRGIYRIYGKVVLDFGFPSIEVEEMARLPYRSDRRNG